VFGAGFVLGIVRALWVVPAFGLRTAELMEAPLMLTVTVLAARWVVRRSALPRAAGARLGVGLLALCFLLAAEFTGVLWLRGLTLREYVASRDPVSGAVYYLLLAIFGCMPAFVGRSRFNSPRAARSSTA
jgi:hypothetical protein